MMDSRYKMTNMALIRELTHLIPTIQSIHHNIRNLTTLLDKDIPTLLDKGIPTLLDKDIPTLLDKDIPTQGIHLIQIWLRYLLNPGGHDDTNAKLM
jgi:hypothetical protein